MNSDMAFSDGWLDALVSVYDGKTLPVSRLVEQSVYFRAGEHAIPVDFGRDPEDFPMESWKAYAADQLEAVVQPGGCYMPVLMPRAEFLSVGGYPEGNVVREKNGEDIVIAGSIPVYHSNGAWFTPKGDPFYSGDAHLFGKMKKIGFEHVTVFNSLVYHMQEGERRS